MGKMKDFLFIKVGPDPRKIGSRLKFVGILGIIFSIVVGVMAVYNGNANNINLPAYLISGFMFLIGIITAYSGCSFEQIAALQSRLGVKHDERTKK